MAQQSELYKSMHAATTQFVASYADAFKSQDMTHLSKSLSPSCHRYLAPGSILEKAPSMAAGWTNAEYEAQCKLDFDLAAKHEYDLNSIVIDEFGKKAAAYAVQKVTNKKDGRAWSFEFSWILDFNQDGTKIDKVVHFVDTLMAVEFMQTYSEGS